MKNENEKDLAKIVSESTSMAEVLRALGLVVAGGNYKTIRTKIKALGLDTSHWLGQANTRGKSPGHRQRRMSLEEILVRGSTYNSLRLKKRLLHNGVFEYKCSVCNNTEWLGKPIALEIDHLDGDSTNNTLENLRLVCPNCHALTPTYRGRNMEKSKRKPSLDELEREISKAGSVVWYAKSIGVSDRTVRGWRKEARMMELADNGDLKSLAR